MSKAREIIKNNKAKTGIIPTMGNWAKKFFASAAYNGQVWGTWVRHRSHDKLQMFCIAIVVLVATITTMQLRLTTK